MQRQLILRVGTEIISSNKRRARVLVSRTSGQGHGTLPLGHRRNRPVGFSGGDRLAMLKIGQLRRKSRREGRPRLAARLVRDKIGMTFEQVLAVEAAQH